MTAMNANVPACSSAAGEPESGARKIARRRPFSSRTRGTAPIRASSPK